MAAVDLRASKTGYLTLDQAAAINTSDATLAKFLGGLPKAELHLHIEGTIEPEMVLTIARRNGIALEGADDAERFCAAQRAKRSFRDLQEFLDLYYSSCDVLRTEQDFFDICAAYLARAHAANIVRAEIFFDPQTHMVERNSLPLATVVNGLHRACEASPVDAKLIMSFLRHRHPPLENAASPRTSASSSRAIRSRRPSPRPKKRQRSWKGSAPTARASPRDRLDMNLSTPGVRHIWAGSSFPYEGVLRRLLKTTAFVNILSHTYN
jgi:hypothetical protein